MMNPTTSKPNLFDQAPAMSFPDQASLDELRADITPRIFAFIFLIGLATSIFVQELPGVIAPRVLALLLMGTPLVAWALQTRSYQLGMWSLTAGCFIAIFIAQISYPTSIVAICWVFLVALTALCINKWAGLAMSLVCTAAIGFLSHQQLLATGSDFVLIALLLIWGMLVLCWTAIAPLYTLVQWLWYYFSQANMLAETARDRQAELALALQDLTEANRQLQYLNQIVRAAQREAEEASRAKVEFTANISHELRTPLNMIIGFSETLLEAPRIYESPLPPAFMADIAAIHRNGCHLQSLIDDVLDLSQIDMRRMALTKEATALSSLIDEAVEAVRFLYESKGIGLHVRMPGDLPEVFCDRTRIREVLLNLLSNAGRFTEQGSVEISAKFENDQIVIAVEDSGPGIAPEQLKRLFEPFQQLDSSIRRRYGGNGLGLAISRSFVEMHGGKMWAESEVNHGSTFYFTLPLPFQSQSPISNTELAGRYVELRHRPPYSPIVQPRLRLAMIGQNPMLQRLLMRYLSDAEIMVKPTLEDAVRSYDEQPFQAIIANSETTEQGIAYLAQRQELPPYVPLILTGFSAASGGGQLLNVTDYLVKPVTRNKLQAAIAALPQPVRTILVADDDADMRQLVERMLSLETSKEYRLIQATNGYEALHLLRVRKPDLLLLDLMMPELDGYEVLREKNIDPAICAIPVFIISAKDMLEESLASTALVATAKGGIPIPKMLDAIAQLSNLLGLVKQPAGPMPPENVSA